MAAAGVGVVQVLLQHVGKEELRRRDRGGRTALHHAADEGREEMVAFLLSHGAKASSRDDLRVTPLMLAATSGHLDVVKRLAQDMGQEQLEMEDSRGRTAVYYAAPGNGDQAWRGDAATVAFLLSKGARADTADRDGRTPLMAVVMSYLLRIREAPYQVGTTEALLQHVGTQGLNRRDAWGWTALHYATERYRKEDMRVLLLAGADPTIKDNKGRTSLELAKAKKHDLFARMWEVSIQRKCASYAQ
jgi:ankyrin repeat protein